jgi:hypothetical protein
VRIFSCCLAVFQGDFFLRGIHVNSALRPIAAVVLLLLLSQCQDTDNPKDQPVVKSGAPAAFPTKRVGDRLCYLRYDNWNIGDVGNGGTSPPIVVQKQPNLNGCILCQIETYHWNGGTGKKPGNISVVAHAFPAQPGQPPPPPIAGNPLGATAGNPGQGGVPNASWSQDFNGPFIPDGDVVEVKDSDPNTWSENQQSSGKGFTRLWCEVER